MRIVFFVHSIISDWNHGNAHFLRGVTTELIRRGHELVVYEPRDAWSMTNLVGYYGEEPIAAFHETFSDIRVTRYCQETLDLDMALDSADLVVVHEWNDPGLVRRIGAHRALRTGYRLLFHDTHHRSVTNPDAMSCYDLSNFDGVLAFGEVIRSIYLSRNWIQRAWTWHEAADTRLFRPVECGADKDGEVVWIGNWGDEERSRELHEYLVSPVKELELTCRIYGVRYPDDARRVLARAGIEYAGWVPNYRVPEVFARFRATVHIPRRPYVEALPGIPTIRPFEALACGIPLICSPWEDTEGLFSEGKDYLVAHSGAEMRRHLRAVMHDSGLAKELTSHGRATVLAKHTCAHRVEQLLTICESLGICARRCTAKSEECGAASAAPRGSEQR